MILYHGSYVEVSKPDLLHSRPNVDFGKGFYTTPILEQAVKWCSRFKRRGNEGILSKYILNEEAFKNCKVLKFESYSEVWLDYILSCRSGKDETEAIKRLQYEKPNLQICFRNQKVIERYLSFEGSEKL